MAIDRAMLDSEPLLEGEEGAIEIEIVDPEEVSVQTLMAG